MGLGPEFLSRPTSGKIGYDLIVGFVNQRNGVNTFAIEVKATERPIGGRFQIVRQNFERLAYSNVPGLLFVADVKRNELSYAWLDKRESSASASVSVPLIKLDESSKNELVRRLRAA